MQKTKTFLTFPGTAVEAMNLYTSLFPDSEMVAVEYYGPDEEGQCLAVIEGNTFYKLLLF